MNVAAASRTDPATAARFFRVLGNATRLRVLEVLESGELPVRELMATTGVAQARMSTHLACLRHCGFVVAERRGKEVYYRLAVGGLDEMLANSDRVMAPLTSWHPAVASARTGSDEHLLQPRRGPDRRLPTPSRTLDAGRALDSG